MDERHVAWGYVIRNLGRGPELLVAERFKKGDEQRDGQLVIPGGGLEQDEIYVQAAIREVKQETGIDTFYDEALDFSFPAQEFIKPNLIGHTDAEGNVHLIYTDTEKMYCGRLISLRPRDMNQEPSEQDSDAKNPKYVTVFDAFAQQSRFTPACQVLLDLIGYDESIQALH